MRAAKVSRRRRDERADSPSEVFLGGENLAVLENITLPAHLIIADTDS